VDGSTSPDGDLAVPVVLLLLDAFRSDYLDPRSTPFLWRCSQEGEHYRRVVPGYGFCERSEILTGLTTSESGNFTAFGYDPAASPYRRLSPVMAQAVGGVQKLLPKRIRVPGKTRPGGVYRYAKKRLDHLLVRATGGYKPCNIPPAFLRFFALTEDAADHRRPGAFGTPSILDDLTAAGRRYYFDSFTALGFEGGASDGERLDMALSAADDEYSLYLIYIAAPDHFGHEYGPGSQELLAALRRMDTSLEQFAMGFRERHPSSSLCFLGDHGMAEVRATFDAESEIRRLALACRLRAGRDFLYFLDSTLVRVWFFTDAARDRLGAGLRRSPEFLSSGEFLSAEQVQHLSRDPGDRRYGDLVWQAQHGTVVFPDFFRSTHPPRGMHGYDPELPDSQGMCIVHRGGSSVGETFDSIPLTGIHHLLYRELDL
jgi:predicted AlkP superfamily pyrophosphatase or phosphodiesterase